MVRGVWPLGVEPRVHRVLGSLSQARIRMGTRTNAADGSEIQDPRLDEVLRRLVDAYCPETIYLFGSYARGDVGPDSDYDIMVVVSDDAPRTAGAAGWPTSAFGVLVSPQTSLSGHGRDSIVGCLFEPRCRRP